MSDEHRVLVAEARRALAAVRPQISWQDPRPAVRLTLPDGRDVVRLEETWGTGVPLRAADEQECVDALNTVLAEHGFPEQSVSGGSDSGDLVVTSVRRRDGARFEWRAKGRVRLWVDLPG